MSRSPNVSAFADQPGKARERWPAGRGRYATRDVDDSRCAALRVGGHGEVLQQAHALRVGGGAPQGLVRLVRLELVRREVAEVLVDEVAGERADHAVAGLRPHHAQVRRGRIGRAAHTATGALMPGWCS